MMMDVYMNGVNASKNESSARKKRQSSTSAIELMVYVDNGVRNDANQAGFSVVDYILGIINIVSDTASDIAINIRPFCCFCCCTDGQFVS